jgi:ribosomal protein L17
MRHRQNKLLNINTGAKKKQVFLRGLLTSLVTYDQVTTTSKRAKVLKSQADSFFSKLMDIQTRNSKQEDANRECIRLIKSTIYSEAAGKRIMSDLLPRYKKENRTSSFVADYKVGFKPGDGSLKVLVKLA